MKVIGTLNAQERALLQLAQTKLEYIYAGDIRELAEKKKVFWINYFCEGKGPFPFEKKENELLKELIAMINSIISKYSLPKRLLSIGISVNPQETKEQFPHVDYKGITSTIFIPLTPVVTQNTISYFEPEISGEDWKRVAMGLTATEIYTTITGIEHELHEPMREIKSGFKPFSLVYLPAGTVHRAVANNSGYDRKMMVIMLTDDKDYLLDEADMEQGV